MPILGGGHGRDCSASPGGIPAPNELGRCWDSVVRLSLPDRDVFAIDANVTQCVPSNLTMIPTSGAGRPWTLTNVGGRCFRDQASRVR